MSLMDQERSTNPSSNSPPAPGKPALRAGPPTLFWVFIGSFAAYPIVFDGGNPAAILMAISGLSACLFGLSLLEGISLPKSALLLTWRLLCVGFLWISMSVALVIEGRLAGAAFVLALAILISRSMIFFEGREAWKKAKE